MQGWIKLHRQITDNPMWLSEPFTRGQAWVDLILIANHQSNYFYVRGNRIDVDRGQLAWSRAKIATRWQWSSKKIDGFLKMLEKEQLITQQKSPIINKITIVNYDEYQKREQQTTQQKTNRKPTENQQKTTYKNDKNNKNEKNDNNNSIYVENFEEFWESYIPYEIKKGSKKEAKEKFINILKKGRIDYGQIKQGLIKYIEYCHAGKVKTKHASRWLAKEGWDDEYPDPQVALFNIEKGFSGRRESDSDIAKRAIMAGLGLQ